MATSFGNRSIIPPHLPSPLYQSLSVSKSTTRRSSNIRAAYLVSGGNEQERREMREVKGSRGKPEWCLAEKTSKEIKERDDVMRERSRCQIWVRQWQFGALWRWRGERGVQHISMDVWRERQMSCCWCISKAQTSLFSIQQIMRSWKLKPTPQRYKLQFLSWQLECVSQYWASLHRLQCYPGRKLTSGLGLAVWVWVCGQLRTRLFCVNVLFIIFLPSVMSDVMIVNQRGRMRYGDRGQRGGWELWQDIE